MLYTRRDFLRAGLGASTLMSLGSAGTHLIAGSAEAAARASDRDTVLVVVQLTGGNDGLNTVVPYADDEYGRSRTTLRLPTGELHKIDALLGFHPRMEAFLRLYKDGYLSIVQGVGYPNPDLSHERALRIWHAADPQRPERQTGWLGRVADHLRDAKGTDTAAVFVGPIARPFGLNAERVIVPCIRSAQDLTIRTMPGRANGRCEAVEFARAKPDNVLLQLLRQSTLDAYANSERIESAAKSVTSAASYPPFGLAGHLRTIARLIRADTGIRIFFAELGGGGIGGFDNHANQLGNHCALLHQLAESVAAFVDDLKRDNLLDRVLLMTFSEFGRTVKENGRRGTGHAGAAPIFLAGGRVKGGLAGPHPSLTDLDKGGLRFHTDFRQVYATVLDRWLGLESQAVLGRRFEPLDLLYSPQRKPG